MGDQKHRWVQVAEAILSQYSVIIRLARPNDTRKHCRPLVCCSATVLQYWPGIRTSWFWRQMVAASAVTSGHAALRVGRWRLSWCSALAQYDVYTAAANISPSLHFLVRVRGVLLLQHLSTIFLLPLYPLILVLWYHTIHFKLDLWNWGLSIFFPSPRWAACHMCAGRVPVDAESWLQPASD